MNSEERIKMPAMFCGAVAIFTALLFAVPSGFISPDLGNTILTISTFLFGIIAGFFIVVTTTDYNALKGLVASETGKLAALHQNVLMYDADAAERLKGAIDAYVRHAFDVELMEIPGHVRSDFEAIKRLIRTLPVKEDLSAILQEIRVVMDDLIEVHQNQIVLGTRTVSLFQWFVLIVLSILPIVTIYGLRTGEPFFDFVAVAFSSMIVLILLIIRAIDLYVWNEETFSFSAYEEVLHSIGELPYYPEESIRKGRIRPREREYRVGVPDAALQDGERRVEVVKDGDREK